MRIYKKLIQRIVITAPMAERDEVLDYCYENGFTIKGCGPKYIGKGKVDINIFHCIAEREMRKENENG